jgi:class 3 adenylate cyclase
MSGLDSPDIVSFGSSIGTTITSIFPSMDDVDHSSAVDISAFANNEHNQNSSAVVISGAETSGSLILSGLQSNQIASAAATPVLADLASLVNPAANAFEPAITNASIGSEGANAVQVQQALSATGLGVNGAGIKVGVLSDSFNNLGGAAADEASGALPAAANVQVLKDLSSGGTDEGRAMMQIVHDIAPGASLAFYTAFNSEQDFANGILALAAAGSKVIVDDVSYFDEPFFQNGVVAQAIQTVEAEGVTYVSAAGNNGSNGYQATWTPISGTYDGRTLTNAESFSGSLVQTVTVSANKSESIPLLLEWDQAYGLATSNLEILVFHNGKLYGTATNTTSGESTNPWVEFTFTASGTYQVAIENLSGPNPGLIKEITAGDGLTATISGANTGTVFGHAMTPGAIAAGAVNVANTPAFAVSPPTSESYSSSGVGTEFLFANNGTRLSSPEALSPVTVSGVDNISTTVSDLSDFYGTSAASASLAGVAALILSANPKLSPGQVEQILQDSAITMANPAVSGAGLVQANLAVAAALAENGQTQTLAIIKSIVETPTSGDLNAGNHVTITVDLTAQVNVTGAPTLTLNDNGTASYFGGSGTAALTFAYTVLSGQNTADLAILSFNLNGGSVLDTSGNPADLSSATNYNPTGVLQIDTTAPTVSSIATSGSGVSGGNGDLGTGKVVTVAVTMSGVVTVSGAPTLTLNDGGTASYSGGSGSAVLTFTYTVLAGQSAADLGVSSFSLNGGSVMDGAGNAADLSSALNYNSAGVLQIDTTAPAVTEVLSSDTGASSSDKITRSPALTGSGDASAVVHFIVDGSSIATTATANAAGTWTFTPTGLANGSHTIVANETDAAGNTGAASLAFTLDTTPPVVTERLTSDTGASSSDRISSNSALTGSADAGAVVHFTVDGSAIATSATANATGIWTFTSTGLADGNHTIVASETDIAGNIGSASLTFTIDTTAPIVAESLANDTGSSSSDKITNADTLVGSGNPNAVVHFTVDGSSIATTATANTGGAWTFTPSSLANGSHAIVASETDAAGNTGSASLAINFDTTLPPVTESLANDSGPSSSDKITNNDTLVGSGDANAVVHFTVDNSSIATTATANTSGAWTFTPTGLANGSHTIVASETDAAGNAGSASLTFTLDTNAPPSVIEALSSDTGASPSDLITSNPGLSGSGDAGAVVHFTVDGSPIAATAVANAGGAWAFTPTGLADGSHTTIASETDVAGNAGSASLIFTLDTTPPTVTESLASDSGSSSADKITDNATLTGSADANALVHFTVDGSSISETTTANAAGTWTFTPPGLADGSHALVASEADIAGNIGSASLTFTLDTTAPAVTESLASDTGSSPSDKITNNDALTGSGDPSAVVHFTVDGNLIGATVTANASGAWSFSPNVLATGNHTIVASETDAAGNTGSTALAFTLDTISPSVTSIAAVADNDASTLTAGDMLTIELTTSEAAIVTGTPTLQLNDNDVATYVGGSGDSVLTFEYTVQPTDTTADLQVDGLNIPGGAIIEDVAGNSLAAPVVADLNLHVGNPATPPAASDDAYVMLMGQSTIASDSVLLNDNGDSLTSALVDAPAHGTLQFGADGSFSYSPTVGFTGIDSFSYAATNGAGTSDAQALLYVVPTNTQGSTITLALLSLTAEEQVAATYVAFFGRGADQSGFEFWVNLFNQYHNSLGPSQLFTNIASSFGVSAEAQGLYSFLANPHEASDAQIGSFLDSVYENLFNRQGDAAGLAYWAGQIKQAMAAGQFVGSVLVNIIGGAQNTAAGQDITTLMSKVAVGLEYVHQQEQLGTTWSFAQDGASSAALLHAVTADLGTVLTGIKQADLLVHADLH